MIHVLFRARSLSLSLALLPCSMCVLMINNEPEMKPAFSRGHHGEQLIADRGSQSRRLTRHVTAMPASQVQRPSVKS